MPAWRSSSDGRERPGNGNRYRFRARQIGLNNVWRRRTQYPDHIHTCRHIGYTGNMGSRVCECTFSITILNSPPQTQKNKSEFVIWLHWQTFGMDLKNVNSFSFVPRRKWPPLSTTATWFQCVHACARVWIPVDLFTAHIAVLNKMRLWNRSCMILSPSVPHAYQLLKFASIISQACINPSLHEKACFRLF